MPTPDDSYRHPIAQCQQMASSRSMASRTPSPGSLVRRGDAAEGSETSVLWSILERTVRNGSAAALATDHPPSSIDDCLADFLNNDGGFCSPASVGAEGTAASLGGGVPTGSESPSIVDVTSNTTLSYSDLKRRSEVLAH